MRGISELTLLHLCDSAFPLGAFAYSDGLESATATGKVATANDLRAWIDVCLDETLGRTEGPAVWQAWPAFRAGDWETLITLDEELTALRPSSSARRSSRAMGRRLLTTWQTLHPDPRIEHALTLVEKGAVPLFDSDRPEKGHGPFFRNECSVRRCRLRLPAPARARASTGGAPLPRSPIPGWRRQSPRRCA